MPARPRASPASVAVFAFSPLSSAQLFVAAGKVNWINVIDAIRARVARMRGRPVPPSVRPPEISSLEKRQG